MTSVATHAADHRFPDDTQGSTPATRVVELASASVAYLGGIILFAFSALLAPVHSSASRRRYIPAATRELEVLFSLGIPLLALVHIAFGSILAMQAFFRATFADTNGAVVGVGLLRSIAPLLTGVLIASVSAIRAAWEIRHLDLGETAQHYDGADHAGPRMVAALIAGPVLAVWGAAVGTVVGLAVSKRVLGVAAGTYFGFFFEMLRANDVLGVLALGCGYSMIGALFAGYEAARIREGRAGRNPSPLGAAYRAIALSLLVMLLINSLWFAIAYLAGDPVHIEFTHSAAPLTTALSRDPA